MLHAFVQMFLSTDTRDSGKETSTHRTKGSNCLPFEARNWNIFILTKSILLYTETILLFLSTKKVMKKGDLQKHRYLFKTSKHVLCYSIK